MKDSNSRLTWWSPSPVVWLHSELPTNKTERYTDALSLDESSTVLNKQNASKVEEWSGPERVMVTDLPCGLVFCGYTKMYVCVCVCVCVCVWVCVCVSVCVCVCVKL